MKTNEIKKGNKKIIIDLDAEETVHFEGNLGISDSIELLDILNNLSKKVIEHLVKNSFATTLQFGMKCAEMKELEEPITPDKAKEIILDMWE